MTETTSLEPQDIPLSTPNDTSAATIDTHHVSIKSQSRVRIPFIFFLLLSIIFFVFVLMQWYYQPNSIGTVFRTHKVEQIAPTIPQPVLPTSTPSFLPPGKQTYVISGNSNGPRIHSITLDPLDAEKNSRQTIRATPSQRELVEFVTITVYSDSKKTILPLTGSADIFTAEWTVPDTLYHRYILKIDAKGTQGSSTTYITPRTNGPIKLTELE